MLNPHLAKIILVVCLAAMLMVATFAGMLSGNYHLLETVMKFVEIPLAFLIGHYFGSPSRKVLTTAKANE